MENNTQLLKGVLEFCVLKFISREPTYGYEIVMHLKQVGFSDLSESTLYPLLLRLEQQEKVNEYIRDNKVNMLGMPLPNEEKMAMTRSAACGISTP